MSYGAEFNMAFTSNEEGEVTCGIHLKDSIGLDISREEKGDNALEVITKAYKSVESDIRVVRNARKLQEEKKLAAERKKREDELTIKKAKVEALKKQAEALQQEINELQGASKRTRDIDTLKSVYSLTSDFDKLFKSFF